MVSSSQTAAVSTIGGRFRQLAQRFSSIRSEPYIAHRHTRGKRIGVSEYRRIGSKTACRHGYNDQEVSKKLLTLFKRPHAHTPIRLPTPAGSIC
jgi:hypothetical protein